MSINRRAFLGWVGVGGVASSLGMVIGKSDAKPLIATTTSSAPAVTVHEEVLTLPWYTSEPYYTIEPPSLRSLFVIPGTQIGSKLASNTKSASITPLISSYSLLGEL